jgi:hypothetical protein
MLTNAGLLTNTGMLTNAKSLEKHYNIDVWFIYKHSFGQKNVSTGISSRRKHIVRWKNFVRLDFYTQIEGAIHVPFDLTFHFLTEKLFSRKTHLSAEK